MRKFLNLAAVIFFASCSILSAEKIRFNRDIRPILSENCFSCHGPDRNARQADLRLDVREIAISKGAIEPGDPENSKLVQRIRSSDQVRMMPPLFSNKTLTEEQKDLLTRWVEQGAEYEPHWAYIPPKRPETPAGTAAIDYFINQKLEEEGLEPVGEASRRILARRVSFDLTGLPPSPEVVKAFVNDTDPDAYKKLVERFLSSPHYGERMAVHWLDLVRYADSVGFHSDVPINVYPYRDYVIRSFNQNKPFDEFSREQLAGDLLPGATTWQKVASAYNRLNRMTNEGGAQAKEYLAKYAADRVRNVSTVWLASTMGCAECHDHKFDPFATKDFYQLEAFFADIEEEGVYKGRADFGPSVRLLPEEAKKEIEQIDRRVSKLHRKGEGKLPSQPQQLKKFASYLREQLQSWRVLEPAKAWRDCEHPDIEGCDRFELRREKDGIVRVVVTGDEEPREAIEQIEIAPGKERITALLLELFPTEDFDGFFLSEFQVRLIGRDERPIPVQIETLLPDREGPGSMLRDTLDGNHHSGWKGDWSQQDKSRQAAFIFDKPLELNLGERLQVTLVYNGPEGEKIAGRVRLHATDSEFPELPPKGKLREAVLADGLWTGSQRRALERVHEAITGNNPHWREIRYLERRKKTLLDHAHESLVTKSVDEPRTIRVLPRGNWMDDSGEIVDPQAPHFLKEIPADGELLTRLDLADWLVDRDNPLTARVFINHLWNMFFGTGLSKVMNDIGSQGEAPVNPELLDWLAVEFMESGWDVKHIVRTMLLSETYRRSSEPSEELRAADPYNRLHGRQSIRRLEAEFIRDSALAVSGLLNRTMGGPSVKPYQPAGYYKELNFPKREYKPDLNENQFRRGLYTHWQRTFPHPSLTAFDVPTREEATAERAVSNTPLQSLVLLNDPTYVEAARAFAAKILQSGETDAASRIDFAFRQAFSRPADPQERDVLLELLESRREIYEQEPSRAEKLLNTGISPIPSGLEKTELAAWTGVARALFNKHEFVMRY